MPWFEVHINADGSYHTCGAQPNVITGSDLANQYNVYNMDIEQWVNSEYQCQARLKKLQGTQDPLCKMCYLEEDTGSSSKRHKELHKSRISTVDFYDSYQRSPDRHWFDFSEENQGRTNYPQPISYHISMGNECNLACKTCVPSASSRVASEWTIDGKYDGPIRMNWTLDDAAWQRTTDYICQTSGLKFVHLIGGEPFLNPRFEDLIDKLIAHGNTDIYLGFTTNGTMFSPSLMEKLDRFRHVDVGVSIETADRLNSYIRKHSHTQSVLDNIERYSKYISESHVYLTVRPVPSALSVHTLDDLYRWCLDRELDVMTNILAYPLYLRIQNLPRDIKDRLSERYSRWCFSEHIPGDWNPRDPNQYRAHIDAEILAIQTLLQQDADPAQTKILYQNLKRWKWLDDPYTKKFFDTKDPIINMHE